MTSQAYEERSKGIWKTLCTNDEGDNNNHQVISYFCKRENNQPEVTGKVKIIPETNYDKTVDTDWAMCKMQDLLFTKKKTKGVDGKRRRITLRKTVEELSPWEQYNVSSLCHYLRQAHSEGCRKVVISWQEKKLLEEGV